MQLILSTICVALTSAVIGNAYIQKKQFYPAVVFITKSNASMAVIYVQFFVIVFMFGKLLRKIFLGTLRAAEFEHLLERFWYALTETCLAFTVFRDDFNPRFVALFTVLLFLKSFHWLAEERVDFMERSPVLGLLFHVRVASLLVVLGSLDYMLLMHAYQSTLLRGPSVQLVFGFEYAILLTVVANTAIKYVLHSAEMRTDTPWENKAVFLLYTELVIGLIKVILYVLFVVIMAKIYALPMFVFRPMFFTIRNFKKALTDVIMSRRAIRNMNTHYPDATTEELRLSDNICIICREDMVNHAKKLPCGHIFHTTCLRSWFQRQQTCPTCRLNILRAPNVNSTNIPRADEAAAGAAPAAPAAGAAANPNAAATNAENSATINAAIINPAVPLGFENINAPGIIPPPTANMGTPPPVLPGMPPIMPPFLMPPFPFMTPFGIPPPPMPPDLTTFSDEELKALEGTERKNVEERVKLLKNIQLMLDAAGILMHNYQLVAAQMQMPSPIVTTQVAEEKPSCSKELLSEAPSTSAAAAAKLASAAEVSSTGATVSKTSDVTIEDLGAEQHADYAVPAAASLTDESTVISYIDTTTSPAETAGKSDLNELRKRRLKFLEEFNKTSSTSD